MRYQGGRANPPALVSDVLPKPLVSKGLTSKAMKLACDLFQEQQHRIVNINKLGLLGSWASGGGEKDKNGGYLKKYLKNNQNHYNFYIS